MLIISNGRHSEPSLPPTPLCGGGGGEAGVRSKGQGPHTGRPLQRSLSAALASAKKGKCFPRTNDGAAGLLRQAGPRSVLRFAKCRRTVYARFHCGKPSKAGEGGALGIDFSCPLWYNNKYSERKGTSRVHRLRLSVVGTPAFDGGLQAAVSLARTTRRPELGNAASASLRAKIYTIRAAECLEGILR